jgi:tRNA dimethylallyltransferase
VTSLPFLAILGSTASGKSAVAMALAESDTGRSHQLEILSVDAMQVYRGLDIGTAKPTPTEQRSVRHHLIDLVEANETFTVAQFQQSYRSALADIEKRQALGMVVGGTGLYVRAIVDDLSFPGQWPDLRQALDDEARDQGPEALHSRLRALDPEAADRMEPTNIRRIVRALEVTVGSGRPFSSFGPGVDTYPASPVRQFALQWPRPVLAQRIEERVVLMMSQGLVGEVERLVHRGLSPTARQALGYKEIIQYLDGAVTLDEATSLTITRTRQFAVRQERWFRRDPRITWIPVESDPVHEAVPQLLEEFRTP